MATREAMIKERKIRPFVRIVFSDGKNIIRRPAIFNRLFLRGYELWHLKQSDIPMVRVRFAHKNHVNLHYEDAIYDEIDNMIQVLYHELAAGITKNDDVTFYGTLECPVGTNISIRNAHEPDVVLNPKDYTSLNIGDIFFIYPQFSRSLGFQNVEIRTTNGNIIKWEFSTEEAWDEIMNDIANLMVRVSTDSQWKLINEVKQKIKEEEEAKKAKYKQ